MSIFGPPSLFVYIAVIYAFFAAFCLYRILTTPPVPDERKSPFTPLPKNAAPTVFEIASEEAAGEEKVA